MFFFTAWRHLLIYYFMILMLVLVSYGKYISHHILQSLSSTSCVVSVFISLQLYQAIQAFFFFPFPWVYIFFVICLYLSTWCLNDFKPTFRTFSFLSSLYDGHNNASAITIVNLWIIMFIFTAWKPPMYIHNAFYPNYITPLYSCWPFALYGESISTYILSCWAQVWLCMWVFVCSYVFTYLNG